MTIIAILASIAPVFSIRYKHEKAANIMKVMFAASISPSSIATNIAKGPTGVLGIYLKLEGSMTVLPIVSSRTRAYCPAGMIYVAIVAATMTKIAMIRLFNDIELRKLGFKLLIGVHDELIGECPKMNADAVANRLTYLMKTSIENITDVPFKCDADICDHWYLNDYIDTLQKDVDTYSQSMTHEEALNKVISEHPEQPKEFLLTKLNP